MYREIQATGPHIKEIDIHTPVDDYELLDFGLGRKLERFGAYVLNRPDRRAQGEPVLPEWRADWTWTQSGQQSAWHPAQEDLPRQWQVQIEGSPVTLSLEERGRTGCNPRDLACSRWLQERLGGVYDLADLRTLNLFGGAGFISHCAQTAGATVVHVDSHAGHLERAREHVEERQVELSQMHVPSYVDAAQRRNEQYEFIAIAPPLLGKGPGGESWDTEVDLPALIKKLRPLVSDHCQGIWVSVDAGSWNAASVAHMLAETLPGHCVEAMNLYLVTTDGRRLPAGGAARWFDDREFLARDGVLSALSAAEVEEHLDAYLDAALSSRRTATGPAQALAELQRPQQDMVLHWVSVIAHTNSEMAYQFAAYATAAWQRMQGEGVEAWLIHAMDVYDTQGLHPGIAALQGVEGFAAEYGDRLSGLTLDEIGNVLEAFVHGLNGRKLKVEVGEKIFTDTETLFLPGVISRFPERQDNFRLYKVMACLLWAQTWYGTWRGEIENRFIDYADPEHALQVFNVLESLRLEACIQRDLPGVFRDMQMLRQAMQTPELSGEWQSAAEHLAHRGAALADSLELVATLLDQPIPVAPPYLGVQVPQQVELVRAARLDKDRETFRIGVFRMEEETRRRVAEAKQEVADEVDDDADAKQGFDVRKVPAEEQPDGYRFELTLDGQPIPAPDDVKGAMESIMQDMGDIPPDYLQAAGEGAYSARALESEKDPGDVWKGVYHEEGAFHYNEWDYERKHYRKNWTVLRELEVHPRSDNFVQRTLDKHLGLVKSLRRTFEALRGEDKLLKKQPHGEDIDIDALVEAHADVKAGMEMTDRLFTKMHKLERNIAVMFMVDMSGSTKGWINEAERESLVLLAESLETLGDRYAIYGFSGMTRKRCEVYRVKTFDEPYNDEVRARISGITPQDYTRMGVTIRHLTMLLNEVDARTKLLITLSDGKPDDYDTYRGAYGIEDTRMALIEAKRLGIHPFCITIDGEGKDYLPHMYGAVNYTVIDEVRKLPLKVSDIYRRLTT